MTWLAITADGPTEHDAVFGLLPEAARQLYELVEAAWRGADIRMLHAAAGALACVLDCRWAGVDDGGRSAAERRVRDYAEQFAVDPNGVRGELDRRLAGMLSRAGRFDFVTSLNILDGYLRACALLGVEPGAAPPGRDAPVRDRVPDSELSPAPPGRDGTALRAYRLAVVDARLAQARARFAAAVHALDGIDAPTTEATRLRNAWFHGCDY